MDIDDLQGIFATGHFDSRVDDAVKVKLVEKAVRVSFLCDSCGVRRGLLLRYPEVAALAEGRSPRDALGRSVVGEPTSRWEGHVEGMRYDRECCQGGLLGVAVTPIRFASTLDKAELAREVPNEPSARIARRLIRLWLGAGKPIPDGPVSRVIFALAYGMW